MKRIKTKTKAARKPTITRYKRSQVIDPDRSETVAAMLLTESDRGCAIFSAEILSEDLGLLLKTYFRKPTDTYAKAINGLFEGQAALSSLSARLHVAYAIGIVPQVLHGKIDLVRRIRNDFAHTSGPLHFDSPVCDQRVRQLIADGKAVTSRRDDDRTIHGMGRLTKRQFITRAAFVFAVAEISAVLAFIRFEAKSGRDPRRAVQAMEAGGL